MITYSDILLTDLDSVRDVILQKDGVKPNLDDTRCVIKWIGDHASIDALGCTCRTHAEALAYYGNSANGWVEPYTPQ